MLTTGQAICGQQNDPHPPLLVMMRDRPLVGRAGAAENLAVVLERMDATMHTAER